MKNNLDYYQHYSDADDHSKFKMLRAKYGWSGEGRFWALNNRIAKSENCKLDLNKKYNLASLAVDLDMKVDELGEFINYLVEDCELLSKNSSSITNDTLQENLSKAMETRKYAYNRRTKGKPFTNDDKKLADESEKLADENDRVKESKVKESKGKESKETIQKGKTVKAPRRSNTKEFKEGIYLTQKEYDSLCEDFGKSCIDSKIEDLGNYIGNKVMWDHYKDHNKTLRVWMKRDGIQKRKPKGECPDCGLELVGGGVGCECGWRKSPV